MKLIRNVPEPFIDRPRLAEAMSVSESTVKRWVRAGMPSHKWGPRTRRFRLSECVAWASDRGGITMPINNHIGVDRLTAVGARQTKE